MAALDELAEFAVITKTTLLRAASGPERQPYTGERRRSGEAISLEVLFGDALSAAEGVVRQRRNTYAPMYPTVELGCGIPTCGMRPGGRGMLVQAVHRFPEPMSCPMSRQDFVAWRSGSGLSG